MKDEGAVRPSSISLGLPAVIVVGLIIRVLFVGNEGFKTDVGTYVAWASRLSEHGFTSFYSTVVFADYPPGYFYILAALGHFWHLFFAAHDPNGIIFRDLVKLPAILADLAVGTLIYAVVRRFAATGLALCATALYLLNPATIYDSAAWGQVDSVAGFFALFAIYALLKSDDKFARSAAHAGWIVGAWLSFGYSLLIKPQAAVLLPLIVAFAFVNPSMRHARIKASAIGAAGALTLAVLLSEPFHHGSAFAVMSWLFDVYRFGASVYAYNTVDAFNLWALRGQMWVPDSQHIAALQQYLWGILLVLAALVLIVWRYLQDRTPRALLEGCAVATLAFFTLATRMHERYLFNGLLFTIVCLPFARRYLWAIVILTIVLCANLAYSLDYLNVVSNNVPGVDQRNLWGTWTTLLSLIAVGTFFWLGYCYLGTTEGSAVPVANARKPRGAAVLKWEAIRHWFDPREGLAAMQSPLDYIIVGALGVGNFVLSFVGYWWPNGSSCWAENGLQRCGVFDETYFARAGEEYLQNLRIYENTHPPLSKLLVTFSMMLFGGMPKGHGIGGWTFLNGIIGHMSNGDNPYGWRFLDVVVGAFVVMLLYCFAKRVTGSTLFATIAALLLTFDGMHFVQSRLATPEGFVVFFSTFALYAFYRFWVSSQIANHRHLIVPPWAYVVGVAASFGVGCIVGQTCRLLHGFDASATTIVTIYITGLCYLLVRFFGVPACFSDGQRELSYAEGSFALTGPGCGEVLAADGGIIDARGNIQRGSRSQPRGGALTYDDAPLHIEYRRDLSVAYETPVGDAIYADNEIRAGNASEKGRSSNLWLVLFTVTLGLLVATKWYGVMGFGVSFVILIFVSLQRYFFRDRPTLWGNPRGFRLDTSMVAIVIVTTTVYLLVWVPDLARHSADPNEIHNFNDVVYRQYSMFEYHDVGVAHATHPYSSKWWEWPLDYVPIAYFYEDRRKDPTNDNVCCVYEITSLPNPIILWFGLFSVPFVGCLAFRLRSKAYALIVLAYALQWIPWAGSPRITFAYHFYVNIPLICLCNTIALQRFWEWGKSAGRHGQNLSVLCAAAYLTIVLGAFVYFYPILTAHPLTWNAWHQRMWIDKWIIGPG